MHKNHSRNQKKNIAYPLYERVIEIDSLALKIFIASRRNEMSFNRRRHSNGDIADGPQPFSMEEAIEMVGHCVPIMPSTVNG